ncbi:zinc ribbon domain-containing protein [Cellulomonas humilata]|uniref:Zinc ribbon domain-containing protein n=1 Tax=Cellulomonas humilata TaxID=144055 RepID=A0A7Y6DWA7_9CELL|nr:zinc ribbon domain-containing protein [Cellulomonas humilata]NUU15787.1 zinc ribbon domain-containing protein [Cellulomonas humilata]
MIVCPQCGSASKADEQFCGVCGAYLVWDAGAPEVSPGAEAAPPEEPATEPPPTALPNETAPPARREAGPQDAPVAAAALLATPPPAPPEARSQQPAAVRPGVPKPAPTPRPAALDEPEPSPGDLVCGTCGAGNAASRKFCRRCGASLADARVQARRSWWSRLWRPEPKHGPVAGYRPTLRRRRFPTRPVVAVVVLGALVGLGLAFRPEIERARITVVDRVQGNVAVNPTDVVASSARADRPASQARDGATNLAWSPADPGDGVGQYLDLPFAQPFRLTRVIVHAGASTVEKEYLTGSSPQVLTLTAITAAGTQQVVEIPLADRVGLQSAAVGIDDVVGVRLTISSTYRATPETYVAIAEVEFRGRT